MATFPKDQFDELPDDLLRVGAHRGPKVKGAGWIGFAWAALATGVLVVVGLWAVSLVDDSISFDLPSIGAGSTPTPTPTPEETVAPITDPSTIEDREITITILNGTATEGLQGDAATVLDEAGWTIASEASASENTIEETVVYYSDEANEDVAEGIVLALGVGEARLSDAFLGAPITVVVGSDFTPTGEGAE